MIHARIIADNYVRAVLSADEAKNGEKCVVDRPQLFRREISHLITTERGSSSSA